MEWSKRKEKGMLPCKALIPDYSISELLVDKSKMTEILKDMEIVPPSVTFSRDIQNFDKVLIYLKVIFGLEVLMVQVV